MKVNKGNIAFIICIILTFLLLFQETQHRAERRKVKEQITQLQLDNQRLDSIVNENGVVISTQKTIITQSQDAIRDLTDTIFNLKKKHDREIKTVIAYYKGVTITEIDSILIPYKDTIAMKEFSDSIGKECAEVIKYMNDSTITVPRKVSETNPHFKFDGTVSLNNFRIDSLSIPDTLQLRFVEKGGFLKKRTREVQFFHSNPLITTTQSNSVIYKPPKQPRVLEKVILVAIGIFLGSRL